MALSMWRRIAAPAASGRVPESRRARQHAPRSRGARPRGHARSGGGRWRSARSPRRASSRRRCCGSRGRSPHGTRRRRRSPERPPRGHARTSRRNGRSRRSARRSRCSAAQAEVSASSSRRNAHRSSTASSFRRAESVSESSAFSLSIPITVAPRPGLTSTRPRVTSAWTASRTEFRPTPYSSISIFSVGRRSPGPNSPERIRSRTAALTAWLSVCRPSCILTRRLHLLSALSYCWDEETSLSCQLDARPRGVPERGQARVAVAAATSVEGVKVSTPPRQRARAPPGRRPRRPHRASPRRAPRHRAPRARGADLPRAASRASRHGGSAGAPARDGDRRGARPGVLFRDAKNVGLTQADAARRRRARARPAHARRRARTRRRARRFARPARARRRGTGRTPDRADPARTDEASSSTSARPRSAEAARATRRGAARLGRPVVHGEWRTGRRKLEQARVRRRSPAAW